MLPKLTIGFLVLTMAVGIASCSSSGIGQTLNVGPNFPTDSFYATNSTQNGISIYTVGQKTGTQPAYNIGGGNTKLDGPRYLAFDSKQNLWVTEYNPSSNSSGLVEIAALATGDVLPLISDTTFTGRPRGIAISGDIMSIADTDPTNSLPSQIYLLAVGSTTPYNTIGGANTKLNVPGGVAMDANQGVYVTNLQSGTVEKFVVPTPSPTPKPTPTVSPSPTPKPTPTPTGSPSASPSPSPSPSATPMNLHPKFVITDVTLPTGVAVDGTGNVYVSDQGNPLNNVAPNVSVYSKPKAGEEHVGHYTRRILCPVAKGTTTPTDMLNSPTDVGVDSNGNIYVADSTKSGSGILLVFAATANGCVAPSTWFPSPGAVTGIGLVP